MDHRLIEALMVGIAPTIREYFEQSNAKAVEPLLARIAQLEAREIVKGEKGDTGEKGETGEAGLPGEQGQIGPQGERGEKGERGEIGPQGERGLDGVAGERGETGPQGEPGEKGEPGDVGPQGEPGRDGEPGQTGPEGAPGRDGRDGLPGIPGQPGEKGMDGRDGIDGKDGLGFDDLIVEHDGDRTLTLKFTRGEQVKEFPVTLPVVLDRGVWRSGGYQRGDGVTFGGSFFIAQKDTDAKPETPDSGWRLAVKRGRDGKDGILKPPPEPKPVALK